MVALDYGRQLFFTTIIDWVILVTFQIVKGYFIFRTSGFAFIVRSYLHLWKIISDDFCLHTVLSNNVWTNLLDRLMGP